MQVVIFPFILKVSLREKPLAVNVPIAKILDFWFCSYLSLA